jgi:hypothetical protein
MIIMGDGGQYYAEHWHNLQIKLVGGKTFIFKNVLCIIGLGKNIFLVSELTRKSPHLDVIVRGEIL